jgi:hypothetical protein
MMDKIPTPVLIGLTVLAIVASAYIYKRMLEKAESSQA